jgi:Ca2+-transporting ATPase
MILTDDNFSTIVKAVELGRGLYDNLTRYIRFQMGCLFGFIIAFLGASLFNIASGIPFLPLQTLWVNFTVQIALAIGLGYGKPAAGLMDRPPRPPDQPILPRNLLIWLAGVGLIIGAGTLGVISWAEQSDTEAIARTMALTTFSLYNVFFALSTRDEQRTVFSLDTAADRTFLRAAGIAVLFTWVATVLGPLQNLLQTTSLDLRQWFICIGAALAVVLAAEIRIAVIRRSAGRTAAAAPVSGTVPSPRRPA